MFYHLRAELEGVALRALMTRGPADLAPTRQAIVDAMRRGVRESNLEELAEKDLDFHRHIVAGSGFRTLARVWESMDGPIRACLYRSFIGPFREDPIRYTADSHQPVVDAIDAGDPDAVAAALKQHILETHGLIEKGVGVDERA